MLPLHLHADVITFGICSFFWYLILLPTLSYYLFHYHANLNDPFIRPRNPRLALVSNYCLMILLFIIAPLQWAEIIFLDAYRFGALREYLFVIRVVWEQFSMWLRLIRYWHCWYKYHYQKHCALSVYIKAMNLRATQSNYFVKHRHTLGNLKFLFTTVLIVWCLEIAFCIWIIFLVDQKSSYNIITTLGFCFYLAQCIVFISLSITMNKTRDTLHIRNEVLYESIAALCSCLVLGVIFIFSNISLITTSTQYDMMANAYFVSFIIFIFPGCVLYPSMIGITSCWVHRQMNMQKQGNYLKQKQLELDRYSHNVSQISTVSSMMNRMRGISSNVPSNSITMTATETTNAKHRDTMSIGESSRRNTNESMTFNLKLDYIDDKIDDKIDPRLKSVHSSSKSKTHLLINKLLSNKIGFELFAEHLINSYAIENLLFLIEVEKFKKNCKAKYGRKLCMEQRRLPRSLPPSVGLKAFHKNLKLQYCYLYHKYIDSIKADFSVNVASRNRCICQMLYNDFYDASHGFDDGEYDTEYETSQSGIHLSPKVRSPRSPRSPKRFSNPSKFKLSNASSSSSSSLKYHSAIKRRGSFPTTTIIGFRGKSSINNTNKEATASTEEATALKDKEMESVSDIECSTKTISILPPIPPIKTSASNHNLSVSSYVRRTKKRASTTITATPSINYPPQLIININEHSCDTRSDQLTIYEAPCELTDNEETTPAPPIGITPQITPQGTPLPDVDASQTEVTTEQFKNCLKPAASATLQAVAPLSPLSQKTEVKEAEAEEEPPKNLTVNKILSIDSVASSTASIMTEESIVSKSSTKTIACSSSGNIKSISERVSISKSWTPHKQWNSGSFDVDIGNINTMDTPIPNEFDKDRKISFRQHRPLFQKRTSASLMHLSNKVPRSVMNGRVDEMMFLMSDEQQKESQSAKELWTKYRDDVEDTQDMIDALESCLKDVFANLRDSFGRFVFSDAYQRWADDEDL
eukprot:50870_1